MHSRRCFPRENEKTCTILKIFKEHLYCYVNYSLKYTYRIPSTVIQQLAFSLGEGWGAYFKLRG